MSQSVCDRGIALVREQIVKTWRLRQDTALEKSFGQLVSSWLQRFEFGSDERHRIVVVLENDPHRSALQRLQCPRLCSGETGVPHRTGVFQYCPNHRDVEVQQVITPGAWSFQLLEEVQSRCSLRRDGVDMLPMVNPWWANPRRSLVVQTVWVTWYKLYGRSYTEPRLASFKLFGGLYLCT